MQVEHHRWASAALGREMELKVYGTGGKPVLVFPTSEGRFYEFEDQGMVRAGAAFILSGRLQLVTLDGVDHETWLNETAPVAERVKRADAYDAYIMDEVVPWVRERRPEEPHLGLAGCSLGAFHAANTFFRHPDRFDWLIALSGVYDLSYAVGEPLDPAAYFHSPIHYLPNLSDPHYLERFRAARLIFGVGQGRYEETSLADHRRLQQILHRLQVPAWFDTWGLDVEHDWAWWRQQWPHFLNHMV